MLGVHDAEDAWSDTFIAALGAYPDLDDDANVAAWLTTIARHKAIDAIRRRNRRAEPAPGVEEFGVDDDRLEPVDAELYAALATLTDRQRLAVVAHHVHGLAYREVAVILDSSPAAARRAAADGIAKLRRVYPREQP